MTKDTKPREPARHRGVSAGHLWRDQYHLPDTCGQCIEYCWTSSYGIEKNTCRRHRTRDRPRRQLLDGPPRCSTHSVGCTRGLARSLPPSPIRGQLGRPCTIRSGSGLGRFQSREPRSAEPQTRRCRCRPRRRFWIGTQGGLARREKDVYTKASTIGGLPVDRPPKRLGERAVCPNSSTSLSELWDSGASLTRKSNRRT
jgi:hypothetical protein